MRRSLIFGLVLAAACIKDTRASRDRGAAGFFENVPTIEAPKEARCEAKKAGAKKQCDEAKFLAELYVRKLSTGDDVCLEGGFGDSPTPACPARAVVMDVATDKVLLELKNPRPDSRWYKSDANQYWFDEGALVDLYLVDHGY